VFKRMVAMYAHTYMCCLNTLVGWIIMLTEGLIMMSFDILKGRGYLRSQL